MSAKRPGSSSELTTHEAIEAVWRVESSRLLGGLVRMVQDLGEAEDLAQDALAAALERWPESGIPTNPGAWLMAVAKNRVIDAVRRQKVRARSHAEIERDPSLTSPPKAPDLETAIDENVGDDLLRLMLLACHPILSVEARVALTLRLLGGLTTAEIGRAFLAPEPTIAQRIVRAKRTLTEARVPFRVPRGADLSARLPAVLEVVYLIFNEGYTATRGEEWMRVELCQDALRLGRILAELVPGEAEVHGLVALMEIQASRMRARVTTSGEPILLLHQDRSHWDQLLICLGLSRLARVERLSQPLGPYALQASIAACHARARTAEETDWARIVALYDGLVELTGSPVVELNRAVAVSMEFGADAGLELVRELTADGALRGYHLLPAVHGDLLMRLSRFEEAREQFLLAASLSSNKREERLLKARAAACADLVPRR